MNPDHIKLAAMRGAIIFLCFIFTSCSRYSLINLSSSQNVPLFTKKNETRVEAGTGTAYIGVQAAHSFTDHVAALGSLSFGQSHFPSIAYYSDFGTTNGQRIGGDFALGYFLKFDSIYSFECFAGTEAYHRSYEAHSYSGGPKFSTTTTFATDITKPFIQADFGFQLSKGVQMGLSCRAGTNYFSHYMQQTVTNDTTGVIKNSTRANMPAATVIAPIRAEHHIC